MKNNMGAMYHNLKMLSFNIIFMKEKEVKKREKFILIIINWLIPGH